MTGAGIAVEEENRDVDSDWKGVEEEEEKKRKGKLSDRHFVHHLAPNHFRFAGAPVF